MKNWYWGMNKGQKIFVWLVTLFLACWGIGVIPLIFFIYCELGGRPEEI